MDIGGILGKLDNDRLGQALGFLMTELKYDKARGKPMFGSLMLNIENLMTDPHFPNLSHTINDLMSDKWAGPVFKGGIMVGVAGWILDEIDLNPNISRIGKVLKTLGFNATLGSAAVVLLDQISTSHSTGDKEANNNSQVRGL